MAQVRSLALLFTALCAGTACAPNAHAGLSNFGNCSQLKAYVQTTATHDAATRPAWVSTFDGRLDERSAVPDPNAPEPDEPDSGGPTQSAYDDTDDVVVQDDLASGADTSDTSTTNNQEAGVDEPDVVKNDGRHLFVLAGATLRIYDGRQRVPVLVGERELDLRAGTLLLHGDRLLAIGSPALPKRENDGTDVVYSEEGGPVRLIELDVAERARPRVLRTLDASGRTISARQVGSTVRLVIDSQPDLDWHYDRARDAYRLHPVSVDDIVPRTRLRSSVTGARYHRRAAACEEIARPPEFSGLDLLAVLTIDMDRGLIGVDRQAVVASPQVVYASPGTLYVAAARTANWNDDQPIPIDAFTDVYAFDTSQPGRTTYVGTGRVAGVPLNQYAFSEWNGHLRVATTTEPAWWEDRPRSKTENRITVLRRSGAALVQVGLLSGLGKREIIYAVRFVGDRGYVVTFRNTDPLFTIDLSDPAAPRLLGELKIPGYSSYLHPLGDDLLLGIGQDADDRGREKGAQASLFDVSDPARPVRIADRKLGKGWARTDYDSHAFLWWPRKQLAFIPFRGYQRSWAYARESGEYYVDKPPSLIALRASRGDSPNLLEIGRVLHGPNWDHPVPQRAVVMGDRLFSISELGVASHRVDDLAPLGFVPFRYDWPVPEAERVKRKRSAK